jgi:hypothetical protein
MFFADEWDERNGEAIRQQVRSGSGLPGQVSGKRPTAIAQQINQEKGTKISGKFVATIKSKLKQASGSAAAASTPKPATSTRAQKKPAAAGVKPTPTKTALTPASAAALSPHISNLKAAAQRVGKDEAKRIIDLF